MTIHDSDWDSPWSPVDVAQPAVRADRSADVAVVGGGITGLLTAVLLARDGAEVLVLDRGRIGGVATRNTTAKISALQGTIYRTIRRSRGADVAGAYAVAQLDAVDGLRRLIGELGIHCSLTEAPAFSYATEPAAVERALEEHDAARDAGLPVCWVEETELPFPVEGAVRLDRQQHFDPGAFCGGLAARLGSDHVAGDTPVVSAEESRTGCRLVTSRGNRISADHVVIATQAPVVDPAYLANRCMPAQSYAIAAGLSGTVPSGLYLSCDEQVRSLRPAVIDDQPVLIVGGEGHRVGDGMADPARWAALEQWTAARFGATGVTHRWATHDLVASDHVPFIGRLAPGSHRRWVATGFAKWGMSNAYVAARLITEAIGGRDVEWGFAFDPTRLRASVNGELLSAGATAGARVVLDRLARRPEPRCTHQGCVLRRDAALDSWACACHGSRFTIDGAVVQGPATSALDLG